MGVGFIYIHLVLYLVLLLLLVDAYDLYMFSIAPLLPSDIREKIRCKLSNCLKFSRTVLDKLPNMCDFNQWSKRLEDATKEADADKKRLMESNNVKCRKSHYILLTFLLINAPLCYLLLLPCSTLLFLLLRSLNNATLHGNSAS